MANGTFELRTSEIPGKSAYLSFPEHPGAADAGIVVRHLRLMELYPDYKGADVIFDFDKDDHLIGIEVMS